MNKIITFASILILNVINLKIYNEMDMIGK